MATRTVLGTCHHDCPDSCGWVVTVEDGVATKLRGNPAHPFSQGELCPKVNRFLDRVYSPDRLLHPLIRSGPKASGRFRTATWDEALAHAARGLRDAIELHGGESVLPWFSAGTQGQVQMSALDQLLFARIGSSRLTGSLCGNTVKAGVSATNGTGKGIDPLDLRHSRLILLWGTNTRMVNRHLWPTIEAARSGGATIVVIDPLRTVTADAADWFVQPLPGTDGALALAMMHVLVRDDLIDHDYVARHTFGFDQLAARLHDWPPERASSICGLELDEIERLATAYGTIRPAAIRTLIGAEHREHGAMFFRTLACLPALVGAWRDRGGGLCRSTGVWFADHVANAATPPAPNGEPRRAINMNHLGRALTDPTLDPAVHALVVWGGNPLVTVPQSELIRRGLERDDLFTIVSEQFLTDTARYADVVFPATTQLEQRDVVTAWGHLYLGWNEPAIDPLGEAVPNTELWRRLARAMGYPEPELQAGDDALLDTALQHLTIEERDALRRDGYVRLPLPDDLRPFAEGGFPTETGKVELWSERLAARGHDPLPTWLPPREGPGGDAERLAEYPLALITTKSRSRFLNSSYSHLPKHGPLEGEPVLEIHAVDAGARGLHDGQVARVWNDRGALVLPVAVSDRVRPGVVSLPFGWWRHQHGDGGSANSLTNDALTDWGGGVAFHDTLVEVAPGPDGERGAG
jgi:anaerobic selenocysteine-containing dehydrogenase